LAFPINLIFENLFGIGLPGLTRKFHQLFKLEIGVRLEEKIVNAITSVAYKFDEEHFKRIELTLTYPWDN